MLSHQENCICLGYRMPHYFWFVLSGIICDSIQAMIDYCIYLIYPTTLGFRETVCWGGSYTISIIIRHFFHRHLVFGEYEGTYCSSVARTYATYSSSIVISILTNYIIVDKLKISHMYAWLLTMLWTGIYNYIMLKMTWKGKKRDSIISIEDGKSKS